MSPEFGKFCFIDPISIFTVPPPGGIVPPSLEISPPTLGPNFISSFGAADMAGRSGAWLGRLVGAGEIVLPSNLAPSPLIGAAAPVIMGLSILTAGTDGAGTAGILPEIIGGMGADGNLGFY